MKKNLQWSVKIFILSMALSIIFSVISQSMFPNLPIFLSLFVIMFFIILSVIFDMIGIAVASLDIKKLERYKNEKGYTSAVKLCKNTDKVSSFCGDVVGDICGILSGAGGVSLVVNMHLYNSNLYFIVTCLVSSFIAGLTIFGKAIMKGYAVEHCDIVVMKISKILEFSFISMIKKLINRPKFKKKDKK